MGFGAAADDLGGSVNYSIMKEKQLLGSIRLCQANYVSLWL